MENNQKIKNAIECLMHCGQFDGSHHKMWTIDQAIRILCGGEFDEAYSCSKYGTEPTEEYIKLIEAYKAGEDGPNTYLWDEGIAP